MKQPLLPPGGVDKARRQVELDYHMPFQTVRGQPLIALIQPERGVTEIRYADNWSKYQGEREKHIDDDVIDTRPADTCHQQPRL